MSLEVLPIHQHPEYLEPCCKLINEEWKRSDTARLHSLTSSCDQLPTSLILLLDRKLIGHLKLSVIPSIKNSCFIESVVIDKSLRGKGYGTYLMKKAEEYCKSFLALDIIYLSTKGQEGFYSKLGYFKCAPVSIYGNFINKKELEEPQDMKSTQNNITNISIKCPPPPPPPPPVTTIPVCAKVFMKKELKIFE